MTTLRVPIEPLPIGVRSQIHSSVKITSLADAVEELLRNSLDAHASEIRIEVDFGTGFCAVHDNGCGIAAREFGEDGGLAKLYRTSKSNFKESYGRLGQGLACISALALVSIVSRVRGRDCCRLFLHRSRRISGRLISDADAQYIQSSGTDVVVQNLFGNLPVRFKAQAARNNDALELERQFHDLKTRVTGYLLAVSRTVDLRLSVKGTKHAYRHKALSSDFGPTRFTTAAVHSIMRQAGSTTATDADCWKLASARTDRLVIRAAISTVPRPTKGCQFISISFQPIRRIGLGALLYDKVNELFGASTFGVENKRDRGEYNQATPRESIIKGVDRWPCFYIRIESHTEELEAALASCNEGEREAGRDFQCVVTLLTTLIQQYLQSQQFLSSRSRRDKRNRPYSLLGRVAIPASRFNFDDWSRARAAFPAKAETRREGLPFADENDRVPGPAIDTNVQILLDDLDRDSQCDPWVPQHAPTRDEEKAQATNDVAAIEIPGADNNHLTWTNPQTGSTIRLNSNSFALPQRLAKTQLMLSNADDCCRQSLGSILRLPKGLATVKGISDRLKMWPAGTYTPKTEAAIPSVVINLERDQTADTHLCWAAEETISSRGLTHAEVLGQVDRKFILVRAGDRLVLIDQHAADERIKVEALYKDICSAEAVILTRPIVVECSQDEARRFDRLQSFFESWAIRYARSEVAKDTIRVTHLPDLIAERCRQQPRMLIDLLRREIWTDKPHIGPHPAGAETSWVDCISHCPADLVEMINSRACRSAVMFNDVLTVEQCTVLVRGLAQCTLPFQCAHGRPSLAVVANVEHCGLGKIQDDSDDFGKAFKRWI